MQDANLIPQDVDACQRLILELNARLESHLTQLHVTSILLRDREVELQARDVQLNDRDAQLRDRDVLVDEQSQTLVELQQSREELAQDNETLKLTIEKLLQQLYGNRRERMLDDPNQMKLDFVGDPAAQDALAEAAAEAERVIQEYTVRRHARKAAPPRDETFPAHLPRVEKTVEVPEAERTCETHGPRALIGYDTTETLVLGRPKMHVAVTKYPKYACVGQPECGVASPERPTGLVEGNRFDTSIAAEIITAKYAYHLPLYRQQDWFGGCGWVPSRSTLLNISTAAEFVLQPLGDYYRTSLLTSCVIGCDETPVTLIVPPVAPEIDPADPRSARVHEVLTAAIENKRPSVKGRMWAYRSVDLPLNVFDFTVSRHRDGPDEILESYCGKLMADCWSGFQKIELRMNERLARGACWAHARRKIFDGRSSHPHLASELLALIRQLYDVEDRAKTNSIEERLALRQNESTRILKKIRELLDSEPFLRVLPKSALAEGLSYLRNHWTALLLYTTEGQMPIDNNEVEQLMKQVALGRKNWLFIGSVAAGNRAATLLTLVSSAVRNDLDVWAYLKDVLDQLLAGSTDYHSLRADIWKQSHPEFIRQYRVEERREASDRRRVRRARRRLLENHRQNK